MSTEKLYSENQKSSDPPLIRLARMFKLRPGTVERISPMIDPPNYSLPFNTYIAATRKDSIREEEERRNDISIYTDGSGYEGGIGEAAVMYPAGQKTPNRTLHYYLGPVTEHSTFEA